MWPFTKPPAKETETQAEIEKERGKLAAQIIDVERGTHRLQLVEAALALKDRY